MRIRIFEMTYSRPQLKAAIDDHLSQLVQNWCLCWIAARSGDIAVKRRYAHWAEELGDQMDPGFSKFDARGVSQRMRERIVKEVFFSDAHLDDPSRVRNRVWRKIVVKEHLSEAECEASIDAWISQGLDEVVQAYVKDATSIPYGDVLARRAPDLSI